MISIRGLQVAYGKETVLNDLNLDLEEGKVHGLVGLNGSGKTTFLNVLYGLKEKRAGEVLDKGRKVGKPDIAYVEAENYFFPYITGKEYLDLFRNDAFPASVWQQLFRLPLDKLVDSYSTGMKKKLAILGALKTNKKIFLLDEPFNGLDMESAQVLKIVIRKLGENGHTLVVTSHLVEVLQEVCDYVHYLKGGRVVRSYRAEEFGQMKTDLYGTFELRVREQLDDLDWKGLEK